MQDVNADCRVCGATLYRRSTRDLERKKYCSRACMGKASVLSRDNTVIPLREIICAWCGKSFKGRGAKRAFCTARCSSASAMAAMGRRKSASPEGYMSRLLHGRKRPKITLSALSSLFKEQKGLCALSGVAMTWQVGNGRIDTNISIDRILPKGEYAVGNIRLVCGIVNLMRRDLPDADFEKWCRLILERKSNATDL
jgi:hypothetical protein